MDRALPGVDGGARAPAAGAPHGQRTPAGVSQHRLITIYLRLFAHFRTDILLHSSNCMRTNRLMCHCSGRACGGSSVLLLLHMSSSPSLLCCRPHCYLPWRPQVMDRTAAAGWPGVKLSELGDAGEAAATATATSRPSPAATAAAEEEMLVNAFHMPPELH